VITLDHNNFTTVEKAKQSIGLLEQEFRKGNGVAGFMLAVVYSEGATFMPDEVKAAIDASDTKALEYQTRSFPLLLRKAEEGDGECMHVLSMYYQAGMPPVKPDRHLFKVWSERAFEAGYHLAVDNLLAIYGNPSSEFYEPAKALELRRRFGLV